MEATSLPIFNPSPSRKKSRTTPHPPPRKKRKILPPVIDEKGFRLRSGCFPVRTNPTTTQTEVLLVASRARPDRWVVPAGSIDPGEIAAEAATRETREEAGIVGRMREPERPLGVWTNPDKKVKTSIFVLDVTQELEKWDEEERTRGWFPVEQVEDLLRWKHLLHLMALSLKERLGLLKEEEEKAKMDATTSTTSSEATSVSSPPRAVGNAQDGLLDLDAHAKQQAEASGIGQISEAEEQLLPIQPQSFQPKPNPSIEVEQVGQQLFRQQLILRQQQQLQRHADAASLIALSETSKPELTES